MLRDGFEMYGIRSDDDSPSSQIVGHFHTAHSCSVQFHGFDLLELLRDSVPSPNLSWYRAKDHLLVAVSQEPDTRLRRGKGEKSLQQIVLE